jgi:antitoxin component of MazEF toxin-antitoxin module
MHRVVLSSGTAISAIFIGIQVFIFNSGIINCIDSGLTIMTAGSNKGSPVVYGSEDVSQSTLQQLYMCILPRIYIHMSATAITRKVRLQKVGNSLRATIPKELAEMLSLKDGDTVNIGATHEEGKKIVIEKIEDDDDGAPTMAKFYGMLKVKETRKWPGPEEIKSIWE